MLSWLLWCRDGLIEMCPEVGFHWEDGSQQHSCVNSQHLLEGQDALLSRGSQGCSAALVAVCTGSWPGFKHLVLLGCSQCVLYPENRSARGGFLAEACGLAISIFNS